MLGAVIMTSWIASAVNITAGIASAVIMTSCIASTVIITAGIDSAVIITAPCASNNILYVSESRMSDSSIDRWATLSSSFELVALNWI